MKIIFTSIFLIIIISSLTYSQMICPPGMISYWKFDEIGNVTTFLDSFGGLNGSCSNPNCPVEDQGIFNRSRSFDGNNEITVPDNDVFDWGPNKSFSIEAWVRTITSGVNNKVFIGKYRSGSNMSWWLGYGNNNTAIFSVRDSSNINNLVEGTTKINDGEWHHIVGVKNGITNTLQIYVDGNLENEISTFFTGDFVGTAPVTIGFYANNFHYSGNLDEIAIYDTILNADQILNHYNNGLLGIDYCNEPTDVKSYSTIPSDYMLYQNYPNPFNPSTKIKFAIGNNGSENQTVILDVYNTLGEKVANLLHEVKSSGIYEVEFNTGNYNLSNGIYIYKLTAGNFVEARKLVLLK